jgi:hypothetical protein
MMGLTANNEGGQQFNQMMLSSAQPVLHQAFNPLFPGLHSNHELNLRRPQSSSSNWPLTMQQAADPNLSYFSSTLPKPPLKGILKNVARDMI